MQFEELLEELEKAKVSTKIQTLIFSKEKFKTAEAATTWAKEHNFHASKVDETENSFRFRQVEPSTFQTGSFRTIELADGVKAVIGRPKVKKMEGMMEITGTTTEVDGHSHTFTIIEDKSDYGSCMRGVTSVEDGHFHLISVYDEYEMSRQMETSLERTSNGAHKHLLVLGDEERNMMVEHMVESTMSRIMGRMKESMMMKAANKITGSTSRVDGHTHNFSMSIDGEGKWKGMTSLADGHFHEVHDEKMTDMMEGDNGNHQHKLVMTDEMKSLMQQMMEEHEKAMSTGETGVGGAFVQTMMHPATITPKKPKNTVKRGHIVKKDKTRQVVIAPVLVPGEVDKQDDIILADDIEDAYYDYVLTGKQVGIMHEGDAANFPVVENYLTPIEMDISDEMIPAGTWMQGVKLDDATWKRVESGELTGFSIQGSGERQAVSDA